MKLRTYTLQSNNSTSWNKSQKVFYTCEHLSCARKFTTVMFKKAPSQKNPNVHHQWNGEINCGNHTMTYYTVIKMNELNYM